VKAPPQSPQRGIAQAAAARPPASRLPPPSRRRAAPSPGALLRRRLAVAVAKRLLPAAALALLAAIALWPEFQNAADRGRVAFRRVAEVKPEALSVIEPRFQGLDDQNRPYTVTAATAVQAGDAEIVQLQAPRADILMNDGGWIYLEARQGRYDRPGSRLDLAGRVTIHHDDGTQLVTDRAAIDVTAGNAEGDEAVAAQGPFGTLTAEGFRLYDRGQVVVFTGRSRTLLEGTR
jgi:lipopolysaccharide export system protein LptC